MTQPVDISQYLSSATHTWHDGHTDRKAMLAEIKVTQYNGLN